MSAVKARSIGNDSLQHSDSGGSSASLSSAGSGRRFSTARARVRHSAASNKWARVSLTKLAGPSTRARRKEWFAFSRWAAARWRSSTESGGGAAVAPASRKERPAGPGRGGDQPGGDQALQGFVGRAVDDFELHRGQRIGLAGAKVFLVQGREFFPPLRGVAVDDEVQHRVRAVLRVTLLATEQRASQLPECCVRKAERAIRGQNFLGRRLIRFGRGGPWRHELFELGEERLAAAAQLDLLEVALAVEHAVGERLLVGERFEHAVLDRVLRDEIDDGDRAGLVLAPGAGDALFELGRIPGQVAIDDDAGVLQVQAGAPRIGAEKDAAVRDRS